MISLLFHTNNVRHQFVVAMRTEMSQHSGVFRSLTLYATITHTRPIGVPLAFWYCSEASFQWLISALLIYTYLGRIAVHSSFPRICPGISSRPSASVGTLWYSIICDHRVALCRIWQWTIALLCYCQYIIASSFGNLCYNAGRQQRCIFSCTFMIRWEYYLRFVVYCLSLLML